MIPVNKLWSCGEMERRSVALTLLDTFPARIATIVSVLGETTETKQAVEQFAKVSRCEDSYKRTNGKTFYNLFLSSAKLESMLLELEEKAQFHGACAICDHQKHCAGKCSQCNCGEFDIITLA